MVMAHLKINTSTTTMASPNDASLEVEIEEGYASRAPLQREAVLLPSLIFGSSKQNESNHVTQSHGGGLFSRPPSAGEPLPTGFRFGQAPKLHLDLLGNRKGSFSAEKVPELIVSVDGFRKSLRSMLVTLVSYLY